MRYTLQRVEQSVRVRRVCMDSCTGVLCAIQTCVYAGVVNRKQVHTVLAYVWNWTEYVYSALCNQRTMRARVSVWRYANKGRLCEKYFYELM